MHNIIKNLPAQALSHEEINSLNIFFENLIGYRNKDFGAWCPFSILENVGSGFYRVTWLDDAVETEGEFTLFCSFYQAMETVKAVNKRILGSL